MSALAWLLDSICSAAIAATRALNADERIELDRLRNMRRRVEVLQREMRNAGEQTYSYWIGEIEDIIGQAVGDGDP